MKKAFILLFLLTVIISAQEKNYAPSFSGYVRAWHQTDYNPDQSQFLVKQARFAIAGSVNEYAAYKFQVDFTRLGRLSTTTEIIDGQTVIKTVSANFSDILLDAQAIITPFSGFDISAGQFKIPYSTDALRSDQNLDFANRPLITIVSPTSRDIGFMLSYKVKKIAELYAGTFNGSGLNRTENDKTMDMVFRAVVNPVSTLNLSGNYYSGKNFDNDVDCYNFGMDFSIENLFLDAEYGNRSIQGKVSGIEGSSFFGYATYTFKTDTRLLTYIVPALRYEIFDSNNTIDGNEVDLLTLGLTFGFAKLNFAHFRINYEMFNYEDGREDPSRLILELQTRF